ncbi:hypothetical protein QWZ04_18000 [Vibrio tapetis subsp. quintayensis]|uniref:hypothetical protein n=1 Tax=Vibrio tapetis TaxID=52443 RepID=UPI0025B4E168|nr:hypothetical protein [Vibrio tapetis]MDN3682199.1 hypothetical protein [Vibrio tapetis subsp. quintayensis]
MTVDFNIRENNVFWTSKMHQLNSDILKRHVLVLGKVSDIDLEFHYCEQSGKGQILNRKGRQLGSFMVQSA